MKEIYIYSVTRCHIARGAGAKLSIDIIEKRVKQFIVKTKKSFHHTDWQRTAWGLNIDPRSTVKSDNFWVNHSNLIIPKFTYQYAFHNDFLY